MGWKYNVYFRAFGYTLDYHCTERQLVSTRLFFKGKLQLAADGLDCTEQMGER